MKNTYRYCHVGDWKLPRPSGVCLVIVTYEMKNDAYLIDVEDFDDWLHWWAALTFPSFDAHCAADVGDEDTWLLNYVHDQGAMVKKVKLEDVA